MTGCAHEHQHEGDLSQLKARDQYDWNVCAAQQGAHMCVAVCCGVLQGVAVCCVVLQYVACLQCVAACCSVLQRVETCYSVLQCVGTCCSVLQCVAVRCSVLHYRSSKRLTRVTCIFVQPSTVQCMHAYCWVLQWVAHCNTLHHTVIHFKTL